MSHASVIKGKLRMVGILVAVLMVLILAFRALPSRPPRSLGSREGRLAKCPDSPNCVCTQATDPEHKIEPIRFEGDPQSAFRRIQSSITMMPRIQVVSADFPYLHAEAHTPLMNFIDDVEFVVDQATSMIHFRSASRLGHSDLGVNRGRMEQFRLIFARSTDGPGE